MKVLYVNKISSIWIFIWERYIDTCKRLQSFALCKNKTLNLHRTVLFRINIEIFDRILLLPERGSKPVNRKVVVEGKKVRLGGNKLRDECTEHPKETKKRVDF